MSFPLISRKKFNALKTTHDSELAQRIALSDKVAYLQLQVAEAQQQLAELPKRDASGKFQKRS
jgi:hypothetical protein